MGRNMRRIKAIIRQPTDRGDRKRISILPTGTYICNTDREEGRCFRCAFYIDRLNEDCIEHPCFGAVWTKL